MRPHDGQVAVESRRYFPQPLTSHISKSPRSLFVRFMFLRYMPALVRRARRAPRRPLSPRSTCDYGVWSWGQADAPTVASQYPAATRPRSCTLSSYQYWARRTPHVYAVFGLRSLETSILKPILF